MVRINGKNPASSVDPLRFRLRWAREAEVKKISVNRLTDRLTSLDFKTQELIAMSLITELSDPVGYPQVPLVIKSWPDKVLDGRGEIDLFRSLRQSYVAKGREAFTPFGLIEISAADLEQAVQHTVFPFVLLNADLIAPKTPAEALLFSDHEVLIGKLLGDNWRAIIGEWLLDL